MLNDLERFKKQADQIQEVYDAIQAVPELQYALEDRLDSEENSIIDESTEEILSSPVKIDIPKEGKESQAKWINAFAYKVEFDKTGKATQDFKSPFTRILSKPTIDLAEALPI